MHDLTDAIAAAHAALDERFYPGPTEEMVACIVEAAAPVVAARAWDEGHRAGWTEAEEDAAEAESLGARRWEERAQYGESAWAVPNPYRARTPKGHLT